MPKHQTCAGRCCPKRHSTAQNPSMPARGCACLRTESACLEAEKQRARHRARLQPHVRAFALWGAQHPAQGLLSSLCQG